MVEQAKLEPVYTRKDLFTERDTNCCVNCMLFATIKVVFKQQLM
jgi:hypothetical protein